MPDFEMSPPSQPVAALRIDPDGTDTEDDRDEELQEAPPVGRREGLPSAYRMRHAPHYVEQLMGGAPIQTVRQISLDQIDRMSAPDGSALTDDLIDLVASIVQVGVLQPLLVAQRDGARFQVLAGEKRLRAAQSAGLTSVPCLVVHADEARAAELRAQAAVKSNGRESDPEPSPRAPAAAPFLDTAFTPALEEISGSLDFVSALMPAASVARSAFQQAVIADLMMVEKRRAAALTAAAAFLTDTAPLQPEEFDWLSFTGELRADTEIEARLRAVDVEWVHALKLRTAVADKKAVATAWVCILHAALAVARAGDRLAVSLATPRVRPAIIFSVSLQTGSRGTAAEGEDCGADAFAGRLSALMLASARQSAQRQGGRLTVNTTTEGLTIDFVAPQPLAYWH